MTDIKTIQQTLRIIEDRTLTQIYALFSLLFIIALIAMILYVKKQKTLCIKNILIISPLFAAIILSAYYLITAYHLNTIADRYGFYQENTMAVKDIYPELRALPIESKIDINKKDQAEMTLIYYKFGCPDCKAIHKNLSDQLRIYDDIYYIYTRSKTGKQLRKKYPIKQVPSAVYINKNGETFTCKLYKKEHGRAELDYQKLTELLRFINGSQDS